MNKKFNLYTLLVISTFYTGNAQKPYFQVQASGGYTFPLMDMKETNHFCGDGWNGNLGFGLFFGKFGIMARGGFQNQGASASFEDFIAGKYKESFNGSGGQSWRNAFAMIGPVGKLSFGRWDVDLFAQIGMSQLSVPSLLYSRRFFSQQTEIARYSGQNDELIPLWTSGFSIHYRVGQGLQLYLEPSFLTNHLLSNTSTTFRYVNANDVNKNGKIDEVEFTEAEIIKDVRDVVFSNLNINIGISYQIGRITKTMAPVSMINLKEELPAEIEQEEIIPEAKNENAPESADNQKEKVQKTFPEPDSDRDSSSNSGQSDMVTEAETSGYDEAEARFLYKAGELYFQNNDFENAVACFNKIKNNPAHLMAKYMFALSMCEMMNCEEAIKEFESFDSLYKKDDAGVLYTVFKSHVEKCRKDVVEQKAIAEKVQRAAEVAARDILSDKSTVSLTTKESKVDVKKFDNSGYEQYKIQFVALKISNKAFPRMENIGTIDYEYYPSKSMYRYTLGPYNTQDEAVSDMLKVRAMGFEDAFLAVYKNGARVNTLYHAR